MSIRTELPPLSQEEPSGFSTRAVFPLGKIIIAQQDFANQTAIAAMRYNSDLFKIGTNLVIKSLLPESFRTEKPVTGVYPKAAYEKIYKKAEALGPGECVTYTRAITTEGTLASDHHETVTGLYAFSIYPKGIPEKLIPEIVDYYEHDLSEDDRQTRFGSSHVNEFFRAKITKMMCQPDTMVSIARKNPGIDDEDQAKNIIGIALIIKDPKGVALPESAADVATGMQHRGIAMTQACDSLGFCEQTGKIDRVGFSIFGYNSSCLNATQRGRNIQFGDEIPWKIETTWVAGGDVEGNFVLTK